VTMGGELVAVGPCWCAAHIGYCWARHPARTKDASRALGVKVFPAENCSPVAISAALTGIAGGWFALMNGSLFSRFGARQ